MGHNRTGGDNNMNLEGSHSETSSGFFFDSETGRKRKGWNRSGRVGSLFSQDGSEADVNRMGPAHLDRLLSEHGAALVLYARGWTRWPDDAVQEAFVELVRQSQTPDDPVAWLYAVVRRRAISAARSESRRQKRQAIAARRQEADSQGDRWFVHSPEAKMDADEAVGRLKRLPLEMREVVVARIWGNLSFDAIGQLTGTSSSTAHRRYIQALKQLQKSLQVDTES